MSDDDEVCHHQEFYTNRRSEVCNCREWDAAKNAEIARLRDALAAAEDRATEYENVAQDYQNANDKAHAECDALRVLLKAAHDFCGEHSHYEKPCTPDNCAVTKALTRMGETEVTT